MRTGWNTALGAMVGVGLLIGSAPSAYPQNRPQAGGASKDAVMMGDASGVFEVKLNPVPMEEQGEGSPLARLSIDKRFHGDLEGTSKGEMLSASTSIKNSAGYVAVERVEGTLKGKKGTFVLQHSGTMKRGEPELTVSVVPDSGTGELVGLAGTMRIKVEGGKHSYEFEYTIARIP